MNNAVICVCCCFPWSGHFIIYVCNLLMWLIQSCLAHLPSWLLCCVICGCMLLRADIEAGWGMTPVPLEINKWRANLCANNSYGVETRTYGLQQSPCKPCQRNTITLRAGATNYTECINPGGFGFSSDGVTQCPKGFWTFLVS